jgi:hypothetical protein
MQKDRGEPSKKKTGEYSQDDVAAISVDIDAGKDSSAWNVRTAGTVHTFHTLYDLMAFLTHIV